jgi:hypothetical protein
VAEYFPAFPSMGKMYLNHFISLKFNRSNVKRFVIFLILYLTNLCTYNVAANCWARLIITLPSLFFFNLYNLNLKIVIKLATYFHLLIIIFWSKRVIFCKYWCSFCTCHLNFLSGRTGSGWPTQGIKSIINLF